MLLRFVIALILGGLLGVERELVGKEAGVRTEMLVAGGAALFAMIGLMLPFIAADGSGMIPTLLEQTNAFGIIANVVVGIGFLGAGLIIKTNDHPHGVTTAAIVWMTAAIGILAGVGMEQMAITAALLTALLLFVLRKLNVSRKLEDESKELN